MYLSNGMSDLKCSIPFGAQKPSSSIATPDFGKWFSHVSRKVHPFSKLSGNVTGSTAVNMHRLLSTLVTNITIHSFRAGSSKSALPRFSFARHSLCSTTHYVTYRLDSSVKFQSWINHGLDTLIHHIQLLFYLYKYVMFRTTPLVSHFTPDRVVVVQVCRSGLSYHLDGIPPPLLDVTASQRSLECEAQTRNG